MEINPYIPNFHLRILLQEPSHLRFQCKFIIAQKANMVVDFDTFIQKIGKHLK